MGCKLSSNLFKNNTNDDMIACKSSNIVATLKAVLLIQKYYRRYRAKCEAKRKMIWKIHQLVEYSNEQNQILMQKLLSITLHNNPERHFDVKCKFSKFNDSLPPDKQAIPWADIDALDASHNGFKLKYPITSKIVRNLVEFYKSGNNKLSNRDLIELLLRAQVVLRDLPNVYEISPVSITICGDIHGNFDDLVTIFQKNCLPSTSNPYLFNGDFVDRGSKSVEVISVLLVCFLQNPNAVFLNRGNHEDHFMNSRYGFFKELNNKYKEISEILIKLFTETFSLLPLATVLRNSMFVVHGGISLDTDLAMIRILRREKFKSVLQYESDNMNECEINEWKQVLNLLWSDPRPLNGCKMNTYRGGGCYFGPDVTLQFLEKNFMKLIIRSHECKMNGWDYCHEDKVLTLFSASNYYELGSNYGAFAIIDKSANVRITQYKSQEGVDFRKNEEESVRCLMSEIWRKRNSLLKKFREFDIDKSGVISIGQWVTAMSTIMNMDLPWRQLKWYLIPTSLVETDVPYLTMINNAEIQYTNKKISTLGEIDSRFDSNVEEMFHVLDSKYSGHLTFPEFAEFIQNTTLGQNPLQDEELTQLWKNFDLNNDGWIDKEEFLKIARIYL